MSPGATCPIAKKLVGRQFASPTAPPEPKDEGVWVTYVEDTENGPCGVRFFREEIAALRHAVDMQIAVRFVKWGEQL